MDTCLLCKSKEIAFGAEEKNKIHYHGYFCENCGKWIMSFEDIGRYLKSDPELCFKLACIIIEKRVKGLGKNIEIVLWKGEPTKEDRKNSINIDIEELEKEFPIATEIIPRTMLNLSRFFKHPFEIKEFSWKKFQFISFCPESSDYAGIYRHLQEMGYISADSSTSSILLRITPTGWNYIEKLKQTNLESKQAFVAMYFSPKTDDLFNMAIEPAVEKADFTVMRIDKKEHNEKICDLIIAEIRRSRFLIADVTGSRAGVYYEAGFAHGLGIPVIWTISKEDEKSMHFDTRQYNHIIYESLEELKERLYQRIRVTII